MNPFLDKGGAAFGAVVIAAALITVLALNAASQSSEQHPVYWVTLPAAFVMFCWDVAFGWYHRHETRGIARKGRQEIENARAERAIREDEERRTLEKSDVIAGYSPAIRQSNWPDSLGESNGSSEQVITRAVDTDDGDLGCLPPPGPMPADDYSRSSEPSSVPSFKRDVRSQNSTPSLDTIIPMEKSQGTEFAPAGSYYPPPRRPDTSSSEALERKKESAAKTIVYETETEAEAALRASRERPTLVSLAADAHTWLQETFPTVMAVLSHLPFSLVPFAFAMFILVQALVTKGWVPVFAYGWDHWVNKTGTVGSIGGMGFLSVILCNVSCPYTRS